MIIITINFLFTVGVKLIIAHTLKKSELIKTNYLTKDIKTIFTVGSIIYNCTAHVLIFLQKEATVSLLFITSGMLFQSMLPLKHMDFMPKATVDVFGR